MTPDELYDDLKQAASNTYVEMGYSVYLGAIRLLSSGRVTTPAEAVDMAVETFHLAVASVPEPNEIIENILDEKESHEED